VRGRWASWHREVRMPAVPSSACPHPRPAAGVQCPVRTSSLHACLSTRPVSRVRCGCLSVRVSGVRCPCIPASAVSDRGEVVEGGGGAGSRVAGWPESACSPAVSTTGSSEPGDRGCSGRAGPGEGVGLDSAVVVGGCAAGARSTAWPTERRHAREDRPLVGERAGVRSEVTTTLRGHHVGPRPSRLVAASLRGWTATRACGRAAAATCSERRPLEADGALTCEVGGGGEGI
jgi:hypothetical protein